MGDRSRFYNDKLIPCSCCDITELAEIMEMSEMGRRESLSDPGHWVVK